MTGPQGKGLFEPSSSSLLGTQPVRTTTSMGKTEIRATLAPDRLDQESPGRIDESCPIP
jgi:hypothetical protein